MSKIIVFLKISEVLQSNFVTVFCNYKFNLFNLFTGSVKSSFANSFANLHVYKFYIFINPIPR